MLKTQIGQLKGPPSHVLVDLVISIVYGSCKHDDSMLVKSCEYEMTRLITAGCRWVMMVAHELTTIVNRTQTSVNVYGPGIIRAFQGPMKEKLWSCCWPGQQRAVERFIRNLSEESIPVLCRDVYKRFFEQAPSGQNYFKQSTTRLYFIASKAGDLPHMSKRSLVYNCVQLPSIAVWSISSKRSLILQQCKSFWFSLLLPS